MKFFIILLLFSLLLPVPVSAHTSETNGEIRVTTHFTPDDDPIVGEQTGFYFSFLDKTNQFKPSLCDCTFQVLQQGKIIYEQPLLRDNPNPSLTDVSVVYTFPQKDVYQVKIVGKPEKNATFKPFEALFTIRVERTSSTQQANPQENTAETFFETYFKHSEHVILVLALFAGFVIYFVMQKTKEKKKV